MQFVRIDELRPGMRLAKPIYNKQGVLLYDRESELTLQAVTSIRNFGLIGLYILEPAEPAPPITKEELEFERFQTIYMFRLKDELDNLRAGKPTHTLHNLVETILAEYGHLDHKFTFNQTLRSTADYTYKHSLNVAILCALIGSIMHLDHERKESLVLAALLHDLGMLNVPTPILEKSRRKLTEEDVAVINKHLQDGYRLLQPEHNPSGFPEQALRILAQVDQCFYHPKHPIGTPKKWLPLARILQVANEYDALTAMNVGHEPASEIAAVRYLKEYPDYYDTTVVRALTEAIHIIPKGCCIELSNGEKCLVLEDNPYNFAAPVILQFSNNRVIDLDDSAIAKNLQIVDIMRTMDNRISIDEETLKHFISDERLSATLNKINRQRQKKAPTPMQDVLIQL